MSLDRNGYMQGLVSRRRFGCVIGLIACCLMVVMSTAQASQKPPPDKSPLRVEKVRVKELPEKKPKQVKTPDAMRQWLAAKPDPAPQRGNFDSAQIRAKLHYDIVKQIEPCWSVPAGAPNAEALNVALRVYLLPDGALAGKPEIIGKQHKRDDFHRIAAESASRAVQRCAPLKLPEETYDIWREIELVFDPSMMVGH